jgi:hypothetical protein
MANNFKLYGYRWVVLGRVHVHQPDHSDAVDHLRTHHRTRRSLLRCDRSADRLACHGVHDRLHSAIHSRFMGNRHIRVSSRRQYWRGVDGHLRSPARVCWRELLPRAVEHVGIAAAQPFLLNAWTKVPANWFSIEERATAVGLVTLANLVGTALGMVLTPILTETMSIPNVQLIYGGWLHFQRCCSSCLPERLRPRRPDLLAVKSAH